MGEPAILVVDICPEDVVFGERANCLNCPVVRALRRMMPRGEWVFDGLTAANLAYGYYAIRECVGDDGGREAIRSYDVGGVLTVRRLVMVQCAS
jgi:hypothetical protein